MSNKKTDYDASWQNAWPSDGLQNLGCCPVCGSQRRTVLHEELVDNVFFCSPGKWSLWRCSKCGSAYLDPRPTRETIYLAYSSYYTHKDAPGKDDYASLSPVRKLRRRLVNGYTNWRYSTNAMPSSPFGVLAAFAFPTLRRVLDRQYRHLPRPPEAGGVVLDVGCGDGSFLSLARTCGWDVVGLDPDPKAAANAAQQGLTVHEGDIEFFDGKTELFDVITLNHVIEHVHDPIKVLKRCHALLKPRGQLWLETPNISSLGHERFQKNWRGLEAPRHLVIFNPHSLKQALISAGFSSLDNRVRPSPCAEIFKASFAMRHGQAPYGAVAAPKILKWQAAMANLIGTLSPSRREFLTITACKVVN